MSSSLGFSGDFVPFFFQVWERHMERRRVELGCVDGCDETRALMASIDWVLD